MDKKINKYTNTYKKKCVKEFQRMQVLFPPAQCKLASYSFTIWNPDPIEAIRVHGLCHKTPLPTTSGATYRHEL